MKFALIGCSWFVSVTAVYSQAVELDLNLNIRHSVDGHTAEFDRAKYINFHATSAEPDFLNNVNLLTQLLESNDVYLGRDAGIQNFAFSQTIEDRNNPGFADPADIERFGNELRRNYGSRTEIHSFESRQESAIITSVSAPFFPGSGSVNNARGSWTPATADAAGVWWRDYLTHSYGDGGVDGQPKPKFLEIMNEPILELILTHEPDLATREGIYEFHNSVADRVREGHDDIMVGGFTHALRDLEDEDFTQWEQTWESFIQIAGANMDFFSLHLYDSPFEPFATNQFLREGGNAEATLDLIENGSQVLLGEVKPIVISEFGSFIANYNLDPYTARRDWTSIKAFNAMLMGFFERPNVIQKTVPFLLIEAEFFRPLGDPNDPYPYRLIRRDPDDGTGTPLFTEYLRFYQFWADVKGTRVETRASDLDIQADAYVDGNTAYVILNNLQFTDQLVNFNFFGVESNPVVSVGFKHLRLDAATDEPRYDVFTISGGQPNFVLRPESTAILKYTFTNPIDIDESCNEVKTYADQYVERIVANEPLTFEVQSGAVPDQGEAVLRIGIGRPHSGAMLPLVRFNGTQVYNVTDLEGYNQLPRPNFFGILEVPLPFELVRESNVVSVTFPDSGGRVSSVALQTFDFSEMPGRANGEYGGNVNGSPEVPSIVLGPGLGADEFELRWDARPELTYFVQESTDLEVWDPLTGFLSSDISDAAIALEVDGKPEYFTRLGVIDFPRPPGVDAGQADFDFDGFTNDQELFDLSTNPFVPNAADTDNDGVPDAFELRVIAAGTNDSWTSLDQINAGNAERAGQETGQGGPSAGLSDTISVVATPSRMPVGQVYPVQIPYSATESRDIALTMREVGDPSVPTGSGRTTVPAGEGVAVVYVTVAGSHNGGTTKAGVEYFFRGSIRPQGGDFSTALSGFSDSRPARVE